MTTKSKKTVENLEKTLNKSSLVDSAEQLELLIERAKKAQKIFATFTQEQVDAIFKAAATAADKARIPLAKMAKEELKQLENSLANDVNVNTPAAVESALEFQDKNQPKDYVPTLFEAVMINKVNELTAKYENAEFDKVYLYGALDEYKTEKQEDGIKFASLDELAFIEAVKEYTALSMLKALKFESFNKYEIQDMAQAYAESTVISK